MIKSFSKEINDNDIKHIEQIFKLIHSSDIKQGIKNLEELWRKIGIFYSKDALKETMDDVERMVSYDNFDQLEYNFSKDVEFFRKVQKQYQALADEFGNIADDLEPYTK